MDKRNFKEFKLSGEITRALEGLKYEIPTEVQERVIPRVLENLDIVVKSKTGSGKTAAFAIPVCEAVDWEESDPQALVLTPTRELAVQVREDIAAIGRFKRIKAVAVFGKQPFSVQERELKQKTHVVVGTPGRVMDHIERGTLKLDRVKYLVIDEADEMLNMGFIDQVADIIEKVPKERVTMLFSATLPEDVESLCKRYMRDPVKIEAGSERITVESIEHYYFEVKEENKFELLRDITVIENPDSCMIFCGTKEQVDNVFEGLRRSKYPCSRIHGGMLQEERLEAMKRFKRGEFIYLVATDVAARGIDVEDITLVINYDIPREKESYVHRTGRTGRAGKAGKALSFATPFEERYLNEIEEYIGFKITKLETPSKDQVREAETLFEEKISKGPKIKKDRAEELSRGIIKLYFNGGKKKKMRAADFVGAITKIEGVSAEDIGIIDILDNVSYVDILNGKGDKVLNALRETTIKGKELKVQKAKK